MSFASSNGLRRMSAHGARGSGFTLVEVLVTLVVLSAGLLGIAALHTASLRNNLDSALRSQASALAADIADRMRSNRNAALAGNYNIAIGATRSLAGTPPLADQDVFAWKALLTQILPAGDGSVVSDADGFATITVQWSERARQGEAAVPNVTFVSRTQI